MGVDLRVVGPRGGLTERRHRQPVRVGVQAAAVGADPGRRPEPLQMRQRRGHRDVVSFEQPVVAGQRPPHRQRLRRRERGVETRHRPHQPTVARVPVEQLAPKRCARSLGHGPTATPPARRPRRDPTGPRPAAWRPDHTPGTSPGAAVRYSRVVRRGGRRRRRVKGRHPQHRPGTRSRPLAGTCLNSTAADGTEREHDGGLPSAAFEKRELRGAAPGDATTRAGGRRRFGIVIAEQMIDGCCDSGFEFGPRRSLTTAHQPVERRPRHAQAAAEANDRKAVGLAGEEARRKLVRQRSSDAQQTRRLDHGEHLRQAVNAAVRRIDRGADSTRTTPLSSPPQLPVLPAQSTRPDAGVHSGTGR